VQLREKDLGGRELVELARALLSICRRFDARLLINDRIDVALAVAADGVHLPVDSFSPADARSLLGPLAWIAASTHSVEEAQAAAGADFLVFGPVYDTPSKRVFGAPQGLEALAEVVSSVPVPVLAIGGITAANAREARRRGAAGLAVSRALLEADLPRSAARDLLRR
jgi:thiamine-phosphate pyrophosphorylase